jgi:hypothetical protein
LAFFVLYCTKHSPPRANSGAAAPSDSGNAKFEHRIKDPRGADQAQSAQSEIERVRFAKMGDASSFAMLRFRACL